MTVLTASLTHELLTVVYSYFMMAMRKDAADHKSPDSIVAKTFTASRVQGASYFFQDLANSLIMVVFLHICQLLIDNKTILCLLRQNSIWQTACKVQHSDYDFMILLAVMHSVTKYYPRCQTLGLQICYEHCERWYIKPVLKIYNHHYLHVTGSKSKGTTIVCMHSPSSLFALFVLSDTAVCVISSSCWMIFTAY